MKFCTWCASCFSRFAVSHAIQRRNKTGSHSDIWRSGTAHVSILSDDIRLVRMSLVNKKLTVQTYELTSVLMVLKHLWHHGIQPAGLNGRVSHKKSRLTLEQCQKWVHQGPWQLDIGWLDISYFLKWIPVHIVPKWWKDIHQTSPRRRNLWTKCLGWWLSLVVAVWQSRCQVLHWHW